MKRKKPKNKRALAPRAKRMNRSARLQSARSSWLKSYSDRNLAAGYRRYFGVDWVCAFKELEILGIEIDAEYKNQLLKSVEGNIAARRRRKLRGKEAFDEFNDQNETFAYIAGYTEGGVAYGLTWGEWERLNQEDSLSQRGR